MRRIVAKQRDRMKARLDRLLDDHGAKMLVILIGLLIVVPAAITWRYLTTTATVADRAKTAAEEAKTASHAVARLQRRTNEALIESCERNGNSVRQILREEQRAALTSPDDPRLHDLFPNVAPAIVAQIIREGNAQHRERLHKLAPVPCRTQYPTP